MYLFLLYDLIFFIITLIYLPAYLFKKKFHQGFFLRLGFLPENLRLGRPIWIHTVSVGEAMAAKSLIEKLKKAYPGRRLVISTVTPTGNKIAKTIAGENDFLTYLPLDFSFIVRRVIDKINPSLFVIAETEIWPNLIAYLYKKNIPVIIVNGRISDRSFKGYRRIKFLFKPVLNKIRLFSVQSKQDADRLGCLGVGDERVRITGNMKFDVIKDCREPKETYRIKLGVKAEDMLIIAGSTHPGEEEIVLGVYKDLLKDYVNLRLLIAPRHPERARVIEKIILKYRFNSVRVSQLIGFSGAPKEEASSQAGVSRTTGRSHDSRQIFILDTVGQLVSFYNIADIVFIGGSLIKKGGHNILEPAFLAKPIIFGPNMFNFRDISELFLNNNACILVNDKEQLKARIKDLIDNPFKMGELGRKAKKLFFENQGAAEKTVELIKNILTE